MTKVIWYACVWNFLWYYWIWNNSQSRNGCYELVSMGWKVASWMAVGIESNGKSNLQKEDDTKKAIILIE